MQVFGEENKMHTSKNIIDDFSFTRQCKIKGQQSQGTLQRKLRQLSV